MRLVIWVSKVPAPAALNANFLTSQELSANREFRGIPRIGSYRTRWSQLHVSFGSFCRFTKSIKFAILLFCLVAFLMSGCSSAGKLGSTIGPLGKNSPTTPFTVDLSTYDVAGVIGSTVSVAVNIARKTSFDSIVLSISGLPDGVSSTMHDPGMGSSGAITLAISPKAVPGVYPLTLFISDPTYNLCTSLPMLLNVQRVSVVVSSAVNGTFHEAMSTNMPAADWDFDFKEVPTAPQLLDQLSSKHIRIQTSGASVAQRSPDTWDFTALDGFVLPLLRIADHSPELQIAGIPNFMLYPGTSTFLDPSYNQFASYAQNLVRYYNTKNGFTAKDGEHVSPASTPIEYWGILNEPNYSGLSPEQYVDAYNTVVPAMQSVDPTLKFVALELGGFSNADQMYVPTFVNNVAAQVDVVATHFYSSVNRLDSDATVMATVPSFANKIMYLRAQMETNPKLANVPIWVTENNLNCDASTVDGESIDNPDTLFVPDPRGSNVFVAAWRPYVFSQVGKAGAQALYQYDFPGDVQYGEIDSDTGQLHLSYWVDYWLSRYFGSTVGSQLLELSTTDESDVETLALKNSDGSVLIMIVNHAVASPTDINGLGSSRIVEIDLSAFPAFASATVRMIDASTDVNSGPVETSIATTAKLDISFDGYGVAFLMLTP